MKNPLKRRLSAWLVLVVYLPMLTLTLLHHHDMAEQEVVACADCVQHVRHSGHFSDGFKSFDDCLVCQFAGSTYIKADEPVVYAVEACSGSLVVATIPSLPIAALIHHSSRAPPAFA